MPRFFLNATTAAAFAALSLGAYADEPGNGTLVTVDATYVFAPIGFDDNDDAQVVVDGYLPNGCYRQTEPKVSIDAAAHVILIAPQARYFSRSCIEAMIPYSFEANLGQLPAGRYEIEVVGETRRLTGELTVKKATTPDPDDYPYAPVDSVEVERDPDSGVYFAVVHGRFTSKCMSWAIATAVDNGATINLLPIAAVEISGMCDRRIREYKEIVPLPSSILPGRHLLHVRSMNGKAVNVLFFKNRF